MGGGILQEALIQEIKEIVENVLDKKNIQISKEEVGEIVSSLIPTLDSIVSKHVKKHIVLICKYTIEKFGRNCDA